MKFIKSHPLIKKTIYWGRNIVKKFAYLFCLFDKRDTNDQLYLRKPQQNKDYDISCAIVMHTCDSYGFLRNHFAYFFTKFRDSTYQKYIIGETIDPEFKGRTTILPGKFAHSGERSERLLIGLEKIDTKYIIYFQEDFWLYRPVDQLLVEELVEICEEYDMKLLKLHEGNVDYILQQTNVLVGGRNISRVNKNSDYLMCHAVSIWNKEFLMNQLKQEKLEDPRTNEIVGTFRMKFDKKLPNLFHYPFFSTKSDTDEFCPSSYREVCRKGRFNDKAGDFIKFINVGGKK